MESLDSQLHVYDVQMKAMKSELNACARFAGIVSTTASVPDVSISSRLPTERRMDIFTSTSDLSVNIVPDSFGLKLEVIDLVLCL